MANAAAAAAAAALDSIPSHSVIPDVQPELLLLLQEQQDATIRVQDFLSLRDTVHADGIVSPSEVSSATTSSKNSVISCCDSSDDNKLCAENKEEEEEEEVVVVVDLTQLSPEEREKYLEMLRRRRAEKKRNAVIDALDDAFGPTALLLFRGVAGRDRAQRVLKGVSDIGERTGMAKMSDEAGKETSSSDMVEEENEEGKEGGRT
ncbi:uncharacterized protein B0T15DRAFT_490196 [Chaetomium strumarium]|uniref:Uncharacterized protein n=1 Tax=Chaetomium strumarium TaxID=1170767 RepID=A0AAJ0M774_9PEZI|nr:hypothetical protein B0T15DRAFT_490196 [Chaetomium strumarium]